MSETPETVKVKATEVKPYHYGLWCSIEGRDPFTNPVVGTRWSEDGKHVWYMLDTHNFHRADPDEFLDLVPLAPHRYISEKYGDWAIGPRPSEDRCENCDLPRVSDEDAKPCWQKGR
jgi:hypothetical protein